MTYADIPGWWGPDCHGYFRGIVERALPAAHFVEVGAWQGRSAASMAEHLKTTGKLIRWDSVDTWQGSPYGLHVELLADKPPGWLRERYEAHLRDAGLWQYVNPIEGSSPAAAGLYADESLDFVFIDGDHRMEHVLADLQAWWPKLIPGGIMAGHDANSETVLTAVRKFGREWTKRTPVVWEIRKPGRPPLAPREVIMPAWPAGRHYWERWAWLGFVGAFPGADVRQGPEAHVLGHPLVRTPAPDKPFHVAAILVDGKSVMYDYSDYLQHFADHFAAPYLKVQAVPGVRPAGQFVTRADELLAFRRGLSRQRGRVRIAARFSNIDELPPSKRSLYLGFPADKRPLRRTLLERLNSAPWRWHESNRMGLWQFNRLRPSVAPHLLSSPRPLATWWQEIADAEAVFALPGVCGDFTRLHVEAMALGAPLITVNTEQLWPGNWRGCWREIERDLSDLDDVLGRHLSDPSERERVARLGSWYYERELSPEAAARRIVRAAKE